jgi:hypothetical protein
LPPEILLFASTAKLALTTAVKLRKEKVQKETNNKFGNVNSVIPKISLKLKRKRSQPQRP